MAFSSGEYPSSRGAARRSWGRALVEWGRRSPVLVLFAIALLSNVTGSIFNIVYNFVFIVERLLDAEQRNLFLNFLIPVYNVIAYPLGLSITLAVLWPIRRNHRRMVQGEPIPEVELQRCRRVLVNLPFYQICVNTMCWLPGAVIFPAVIAPGEAEVWKQFTVSFVVAAGLTVVQTFFFMEEFLIRVLYPIYFRDRSPAEVRGGFRISFFWRLFMLWAAVAFMPLFAVLVIADNVMETGTRVAFLLTAGGGLVSGGAICFFVGRGLLRWLRDHQKVTDEIAQRNFAARVREKRPDEWGLLSDHVNEMAGELGAAELMRETFGQIVHPAVRDAIIERYQGLGGEVQEITVLFADIRGFTRRSAGEPPEKVVELLNRFLTLAVAAVEERGGLVNKFLGDGIMALFGTPEPHADHASMAVAAARMLLQRLGGLNRELEQQGAEPLRVGIGIHSGPALTGCVGAALVLANGKATMRREFTAIGETVNLGQRLEQLTKTLGGPILMSENTRRKLRAEAEVRDLGEQEIPGFAGRVRVYQVGVVFLPEEVA
jgi:adenylate cyclase